jgi:hypothetical protein
MSVADSKGFRYQTDPNYYNYSPSTADLIREANRQQIGGAKGTEPARDSRYPAYAAPMSDGRLVTDYRPKCSRNITAGQQFDTKQWMVHNAMEIMDTSRRRQVEWTGGNLMQPVLAPPPADVISVDADVVNVIPSGLPGGIGVQRANETTPDLFGTFQYMPSSSEEMHNKKRICTTSFFEGGRNTPRGRMEFQPAGREVMDRANYRPKGLPTVYPGNEGTVMGLTTAYGEPLV